MNFSAGGLPLKKMREVVKTGCATGMYWSNLDRFIGSRTGVGQSPLTIGYHRIVENFQYSAKFSISPQLTSTHVFEKQLDWIGKNYEFVSLDDLVTAFKNGKSRKPVAAITFDDGYSDVYHNALPILVRKGIPAAAFVVSDLVGTSRLLVHDELYLLMDQILDSGESMLNLCFDSLYLPEPRLAEVRQLFQSVSDPFQATRAILGFFSQLEINLLLENLREKFTVNDAVLQEFELMDWEMLRSMVSQGITVGSHSKSHALLAHHSPEVVKEELEGSRRTLEQHLGLTIRHLAYPDGLFDGNVVHAAVAAGYCSAYTTCNHLDRRHPLLTISRKMLWERSSMNNFGKFSPPILRCQINGIFDPATKCRIQHWN